MVRSIRPIVVGLTCLLAVSAVPAAPTYGDPPPPGQAAEKDAIKDGRAGSFALPGEDPPQPFVPRQPRSVEDRKRLEAVTAFSVSRALEDKRNWSEAIVLLEDALKLEPESVTILRRLSRLCFVLGRTEPGITYCKRVLEVDPGDTDTITRLVTYYNRRNDPGGAETVLKDVLANPRLDRNAPGRLVADYELGKLYAGKLRQPEKAADCFARVVEALDQKSANRLSQADQRRVLGGDEAEAYQEFGLVFLQAKRDDLAIKAFLRGLSYEPDDPQLPLLLAQTLLKAGRGEEALAQVDRFLKRQPQGVEGYELQAKILKALKREKEILPRIEEAAKNDSKNVALQYTLADRYREDGQVERAEAMYKSLLATQPTPQGFGALATSLLKRKKAEELLKVLEQALGRPGGREAVLEQVSTVVKDPEFSGEVLDAGLKMVSADPPTLGRTGVVVLASIAAQSGQLARFLPIQRLVVKQSPTPLAYKELVSVLIELKKYEDGAATFEEMLKKYPEERKAPQLISLARLYWQCDKPEEAALAAREAVTLEPTDPDALNLLAAALGRTGKADEALTVVRAAVKKDPNNPAVGSILGSLLTQAGRNDEALALFKGMIEKFPNSDEVLKLARSNLSIIYINMGDYAKGEAELESLLERNPDEPGVNNDLGYLYADQGKKLEKAESMIRKALQGEPENKAYLDSLGWVLFKRGKAKEAIEPMEKAVKQVGNVVSGADATIFEHLGDVYFQLGEAAKAKSAWKTAEKAAARDTPPDKRLPEIRKKLESLEKLNGLPKPSAGVTP